jgi:hypothetical protein
MARKTFLTLTILLTFAILCFNSCKKDKDEDEKNAKTCDGGPIEASYVKSMVDIAPPNGPYQVLFRIYGGYAPFKLIAYGKVTPSCDETNSSGCSIGGGGFDFACDRPGPGFRSENPITGRYILKVEDSRGTTKNLIVLVE